jgi:hypothetical protein
MTLTVRKASEIPDEAKREMVRFTRLMVTDRLQVPGGWLYRTAVGAETPRVQFVSVATTFVPSTELVMCGDCRFRWPIVSDLSDDSTGQCRRYAPTTSGWPVTKRSDVCPEGEKG